MGIWSLLIGPNGIIKARYIASGADLGFSRGGGGGGFSKHFCRPFF